MSSITDVFTELVEGDKYSESIKEANNEGKTSIIIDYNDIRSIDESIGNKIIEDTKSMNKQLINTIKTIYHDTSIRNVRYEGLPLIPLKDIMDSIYVNKLVSTEGIIRIRGDIYPRPWKTTYICGNCGEYETTITHDNQDVIEIPGTCKECEAKGKWDIINRNFLNRRTINLQENPEGMEQGTEPVQLKAGLEDDLTKIPIEAGDFLKITGVLEVVEYGSGKNITRRFFLNVNNVEREERGYEDIEYTEEEKKEFIEISKLPTLEKDIQGSIAPRIEGEGMAEVKRAIALQLFGGVPELEDDGVLVPGDIHILLVGDPGIGKSHILKHISKNLAPRGIYTTGGGSSGVGLTASVTKTNEYGGEWKVEAGAMVLGDKGVVVIDEFDKMPPEERGKIHEALADQTVSIAKAGVNVTLNSRCTVLAGANPKGGRIDWEKPIKKQIDLPSTIINRFDLLYLLPDTPDVEKDGKVAEVSLDEEYRRSKRENKIPRELLRKYIAYARTNINPKLSKEAIEKLKEFYTRTRAGTGADDPVPITARFIQGLRKLTQARARMHLREEVTIEDVEEAIDIVTNCLKTVGIDPLTGKVDIDRVEGRTPASKRKIDKIVKDVIEELEAEYRTSYMWYSSPDIKEDAIDTIIKELKVKGVSITREHAEKELREGISSRVSGVKDLEKK